MKLKFATGWPLLLIASIFYCGCSKGNDSYDSIHVQLRVDRDELPVPSELEVTGLKKGSLRVTGLKKGSLRNVCNGLPLSRNSD